MRKQVVVRTVPTKSVNADYWYYQKTMQRLQDKLDLGYVVVMCNRIGEDLEYILEKEEEE